MESSGFSISSNYVYAVVGWIGGLLTFVGCYIYCVAAYGFPLGSRLRLASESDCGHSRRLVLARSASGRRLFPAEVNADPGSASRISKGFLTPSNQLRPAPTDRAEPPD